MTTATLGKENVELGLVHSFRGLVHYCHSGTRGSTQADTALGKELGVQPLVLHAAEVEMTLGLA